MRSNCRLSAEAGNDLVAREKASGLGRSRTGMGAKVAGSGRRETGSGEEARLDQTVETVAGIAEAGDDVAVLVQVVVDRTEHDVHLTTSQSLFNRG